MFPTIIMKIVGANPSWSYRFQTIATQYSKKQEIASATQICLNHLISCSRLYFAKKFSIKFIGKDFLPSKCKLKKLKIKGARNH